MSIASPLTRPSPLFRRVGIRIITFEACSDFTHVTARWIAQPPEAAFVTRLRPDRLPNQAARQLPKQSTTLRVKSSSTGGSRLRGALNKQGVCPEPEWPYDTSKFTQKPPAKCYKDALQTRATSYSRLVRTMTEMKGCLASGYPFVFGFTV